MAKVAPSKPRDPRRTKRFSIMLTEDLHRKIRVTAAAYGTSMEDQVYRLLERTDWEDVAVKKGRGPP